MNRATFAERFAAASQAAWQVGRRLVAEELPSRLVFRVRLNQSYDGSPPEIGEVRYPQDGDPGRSGSISPSSTRRVPTP